MRQRPEQVLVVRTGALGDVVNALVFAAALTEAWPDVRIGWVGHEPVLPLLAGHPAVERVHLWRRAGGLAGFLEVAREVRAVGYDLAVDLQRITKSALLARASGAPRVLGFDRARAKESSWIWTRERIATGPRAAHMVEQYLEFARHLGLAATTARHGFRDHPAAAEYAGGLVAELGAAPVVLALGATKPANRWEPERFGRLAACIAREFGQPVCLTGSGGERPLAERALAALRAEAGPAHAVRDLVGRTDLLQLSALLARARLFVGCDTGPMHLAAARGVPVVALFGPADPRRTGPYGRGHRVVRVPPPCAPCHRRTCNQPRHACMEDIEVPLVLAQVQAALASSSPVAPS